MGGLPQNLGNMSTTASFLLPRVHKTHTHCAQASHSSFHSHNEHAHPDFLPHVVNVCMIFFILAFDFFSKRIEFWDIKIEEDTLFV